MTTAVVKADHRRVKSAAFLFVCGCAGAAPHWLDNVRALWPAFTLAFVLGGYGLRTVMRAALGQTAVTDVSAQPWSDERYPSLDVVGLGYPHHGWLRRRLPCDHGGQNVRRYRHHVGHWNRCNSDRAIRLCIDKNKG